MSKIIVFYSKTGTTTNIAEEYAGKNNTSIYGIKDLADRKGFFGKIKDFFQTVMKKEIPIEELTENLSNYSRVILCTPIWFGKIPASVRSFLKIYSESINKVEYIIIRTNPRKEYKAALKEMDSLIGRKHVRITYVEIEK